MRVYKYLVISLFHNIVCKIIFIFKRRLYPSIRLAVARILKARYRERERSVCSVTTAGRNSSRVQGDPATLTK